MTTTASFLAKIDIAEIDRCWEWLGTISPNGYGRTEFLGETYAHRAMAKLLKMDMSNLILHTCDNKSCVNPFHLFSGTDKDNAADRDAKGRNGTIGSNPRKLSDDDVLVIQYLHLSRQNTEKELAEMFGVCIDTIHATLKRDILHATKN